MVVNVFTQNSWTTLYYKKYNRKFNQILLIIKKKKINVKFPWKCNKPKWEMFAIFSVCPFELQIITLWS